LVNPTETWVYINKKRSSTSSRFISEAGYLEFFFIGGSKKEISDKLSRLVGKPSLITESFFGFQQSRWSYQSAEEVIQISRKFDEMNLPHDVLWLDLDYLDQKKYFTWNSQTFPNPEQFLDYFAKSKRNIVGIIDPHLAADDKYFPYREMKSKKLFIRDKERNQFFGYCWPGLSSWPSFISHQTRSWWETLYQYDRWKGSKPNLFVWNDMNEIAVFGACVDNTADKDLLHIDDYGERGSLTLWSFNVISVIWRFAQKRQKSKSKAICLDKILFCWNSKICNSSLDRR
jgi:alpha 1,3-glucosidase